MDVALRARSTRFVEGTAQIPAQGSSSCPTAARRIGGGRARQRQLRSLFPSGLRRRAEKLGLANKSSSGAAPCGIPRSKPCLPTGSVKGAVAVGFKHNASQRTRDRGPSRPWRGILQRLEPLLSMATCVANDRRRLRGAGALETTGWRSCRSGAKLGPEHSWTFVHAGGHEKLREM